MTISERLLKLRKEKGLSQEDLANELGVTRQTVSKWETGESSPDFDKIIPLCIFYGITSDELLTGKTENVETKDNDKKQAFAKNIAIAVGLYIFSLVIVILFGALFQLPIIGVCLFFMIIAIATGLLIYNGLVNAPTKNEEKNKNKEVKLVCEIIDLLGLVLYFIISFTTNAWHITWIIFLIIGLCEIIAKLIFHIKDKDLEGEDDNE